VLTEPVQRFLFQAAMGDSIRVGIISLPNMFYGPFDWWHSSKGFREVMNEAFGYYYVKTILSAL